MIHKESFRVSLGGVLIKLEDAFTLEGLKEVIGDLIDVIESGLCGTEEEEEEGETE